MSRFASLPVCCCLLVTVAVTVASVSAQTNPKPMWSATQPVSIYYNVGLSYHRSADSSVYAAVTAFDDPSTTAAFRVEDDATTSYTFQPPDSTGRAITTQSATARHIELQDPGINMTHSAGAIDLVVASHDASSLECVLYGLASNATTAAPAWSVKIAGCTMPFDGEQVLGFADDGSMVAFASRTVGEGPSGKTPGLVMYYFHGQTGAALGKWNAGINATEVAPRSLTMSHNGGRVAFVGADTIYVVNTTSNALASPHGPVVMPWSVDVTMCPMGVFLTFGFVGEAYVYRWQPAQQQYVKDWTVAKPGWIVETSTHSVNGEDMNPDGCLVAFGWIRGDGLQGAVSVHSMLTQKLYWTYETQVNTQLQELPSGVAMHLDYVAVSLWGDGSAAGTTHPTVLLFSIYDAKPLMTFQSPGSMFSVDVVVDAAQQPPEALRNDAVGTDLVYVTAAGKHVHANERGDGGNAYAWKLSYPAHA